MKGNLIAKSTLLAAFCCLAILLASNAAASASSCSTLKTSFSIVERESVLYLDVEVSNPTQSPIELKEWALNESSFDLSAQDAQGNDLKLITALIGVGATPLILEAGENRTESFNLYGSFPEMRDALRRGEVTLTWKVELAPLGEKCAINVGGSAQLAKDP